MAGLLLCCVCLGAGAQDTGFPVPGGADVPEAGLLPAQAAGGYRLNPSIATVRQGLRFNLSVELPISVSSGVEVAGLEWPEELVFLEGPVLTRITPSFGEEFSPGGRLSFTLRAAQAGWQIIGSFTIRSENESFAVQETVLPVYPAGTADSVPPRLSWRMDQPVLTVGQSAALILEISMIDEYLLPDALSINLPAAVVAEEVTGIGRVSSHSIGGVDFQTYPVASFILTADTPGSLSIPGASVTVRGVEVTGPSFSIDVVPAPSQIEGTGAVGTYALTGTASAQRSRIGEIIRYTVRIEGEGNLNYLQIPALSITGGRVTSQTESFRFTPTLNGYRGFREIVFRIVSEQEGPMTILLPEYRWYDPALARVASSSPLFAPVIVEPAIVDPLDAQAELALLPPETVLEYRMLDLYARPESYVMLLVPAFIGGGILLNKRVKKVRRRIASRMVVFLAVCALFVFPSADGTDADAAGELDSLVRAETAFRSGDFDAALEAYDSVLRRIDGSNPAVLFNRGVVLSAGARHTEAVFMFRQALRRLPTDSLFRSALSLVEQSRGLIRQFSVPVIPHGDVFFAIFASAVSLLLLFLPFWAREIGAGKIVALTVLSLVIIGSCVGFGVYSGVRYAPECVVMDGDGSGQVFRIPEAAASVWLELPAGTSAVTLHTSGEFSLVRTSYGIEGWMKTSGLWLREDIDG